MKLVLLERVLKLGNIGDIVEVKNGYARNFLIPLNKAMRATKAALERFESGRQAIEAESLKLKESAVQAAKKLEGKSVVVIRQAGPSGQLYGSVNARDVAGLLVKDGFDIKRQVIEIKTTIKSLGVYEVYVALHPEVIVPVKVNVALSLEEAAVQMQEANKEAGKSYSSSAKAHEDFTEGAEA